MNREHARIATRAGKLIVDSEGIEDCGSNAVYINIVSNGSKTPYAPETVVCVRDTDDGELELCVWNDPSTHDYTHVFKYKNPWR